MISFIVLIIFLYKNAATAKDSVANKVIFSSESIEGAFEYIKMS